MKVKFLLIFGAILATGCSRKENLHSVLSGKTKEIKRIVLLVPIHETGPLAGVEFNLQTENEQNRAYSGDRLRVGDKVIIESVAKYKTDTRGEWIGVKGKVAGNHRLVGRKFIFCWSFGSSLKVAPWEPPETQSSRSVISVLGADGAIQQ